MSKNNEIAPSGSKVTFTKHLVRNPVKTDVRGVVINERETIEPLNFKNLCSSSEPTSILQTTSEKNSPVSEIDGSMKRLSLNTKSEKESRIKLSDKSTNLSKPGIDSSLSINKKIDGLGRIKSVPTKNKRAFDDKVTRQVNFPYEKKIYKDLMPLSSPNKYVHRVISSREPMPPKDQEPSLEDFIEQSSVEEYSYVPNFKLETRKGRAHCNNLRLYKVIQFSEKC